MLIGPYEFIFAGCQHMRSIIKTICGASKEEGQSLGQSPVSQFDEFDGQLGGILADLMEQGHW